jgi:hypothetical protein
MVCLSTKTAAVLRILLDFCESPQMQDDPICRSFLVDAGLPRHIEISFLVGLLGLAIPIAKNSAAFTETASIGVSDCTKTARIMLLGALCSVP